MTYLVAGYSHDDFYTQQCRTRTSRKEKCTLQCALSSREEKFSQYPLYKDKNKKKKIEKYKTYKTIQKKIEKQKNQKD